MATATANPRLREPRIRLGVSSCLLGETVRYDGGHKLDRFLVNQLGEYVEYVPVCPEVECGLPTPRESMRLIGDPAAPRLIAPRSGTDHTERMQAWIATRLDQLAGEGLHGFVFKKDSPSSGAFRVKVYHPEHGMAERAGSGLFAAAFMQRFPWLPVEEEGRLNDPPLRENFIDRIFTYQRFTAALAADRPAAGELVRFHTSVKLTLMAHSPAHYQELGRLVAAAGSRPWPELFAAYRQGLMDGMKELATRGRHANVLQHLMGYLKDDLAAADKTELLTALDDYRLGLLPLIVPLTLLQHHLGRHPVPDWVHQQAYLHPYPKELMLRNHV
jgi:uncharacterized protein YbgA (DUF1722 family)/uncharacterized protein YbbK (DUF523 family)